MSAVMLAYDFEQPDKTNRKSFEFYMNIAGNTNNDEVEPVYKDHQKGHTVVVDVQWNLYIKTTQGTYCSS